MRASGGGLERDLAVALAVNQVLPLLARLVNDLEGKRLKRATAKSRRIRGL